MPDVPGGRWRGWLRALPVLRGVLPIGRSRVPADMLAGLTLAALGVPEVLGYAKIAGMPLVTGLYTMLLPMAVFAVLGSSRHLVVAADSATAAILAAALTGLAVAGSPAYVRLAGLAALLAGAMLLVARLARLGFLANFLSRTVLVGFLAGVGIQVAAGQLPDMLGITAAGQQTVPRLLHTARALPHAHLADVAISIGVIVIVVAARRITRRIPGTLIAVIVAIIVSWAVGLASHGVAVIGNVPRGLPSLGPARPRLARRRRAARRRGVDLRRHPGAERGHLAGLRGEVRRPFNENVDLVGLAAANVGAASLRHVRGQRQPDQDADGRQRRRPQPARAARRRRRRPRRPAVPHRAAGLHAGRRPGGGRLPDRCRAHRRPGMRHIRACRKRDTPWPCSRPRR